MPRQILTVRWDRGRAAWWCRELGMGERGGTKQALIRYLALLLRNAWTKTQTLGQLRVFGKHGRIQFERTYGRDPRRAKG